MSDRAARSPRRLVAWGLIVLGAIALAASFALTVEKFAVLEDPQAPLACDFSVLVQCGTNLSSAQGAVFGFPNPLIGIIGFTVIVAIGVGVLAGARFARWFWVATSFGMTAALGFVVWLIVQSVFELGTLCPWCMVVWATTIPLFLLVVSFTLSGPSGRRGTGIRRIARRTESWIPLITVACYLVIAVVAQLRLDLLSFL